MFIWLSQTWTGTPRSIMSIHCVHECVRACACCRHVSICVLTPRVYLRVAATRLFVLPPQVYFVCCCRHMSYSELCGMCGMCDVCTCCRHMSRSVALRHAWDE